jgi:hypothetical protein
VRLRGDGTVRSPFGARFTLRLTLRVAGPPPGSVYRIGLYREIRGLFGGLGS